MLDKDNRTSGDDSIGKGVNATENSFSGTTTKGNKANIKTGYIVMHALVLALGMLQFGVLVGSFNPISLIFQYNLNWTQDQLTNESTIGQTVGNAGALVGSFAVGGIMSRFSKKNTMHILNLVCLIGTGMQLTTNMIVFDIGKTIQGFAAGAYSGVCPGFIVDISPFEIGGPIGGISQLVLTFGILLPSLLSLPIPNVTTDTERIYENDYLVTSFWIWIIIIPGVFAALQSLLLLTFFNYDSPLEMKKSGQQQKLLHLMRRMYATESEVNIRMNQIQVEDSDAGATEEKISYTQVLTDSRFKMATFVGIATLSFAQLTGMNGVMFYGGQIFSGGDLSPFVATVVINGVNFLACFGNVAILMFLGKRPTMLFAQMLCTVGMICMFIFEAVVPNDSALLGVCIVFICGFEFGPGAVGWPYVSEICTTEGAVLATGANWFWTLVVGLTFNYLNGVWMPTGYVFLLYGSISFVGFLFYLAYFKETRGLTRDETQRLFRKDQQQNYQKFDSRDDDL